jgi:rhodanese-related sulfurtransferase
VGLLNIFKKKNANPTLGKIEVISKEAFAQAVKKPLVQLVDVRTKNEVLQGKIDKAKHIDFFSSNFEYEILQLDRSKKVYIYCRSGNRSQKAAKIMQRLGFVYVIDLEGGYMNY